MRMHLKLQGNNSIFMLRNYMFVNDKYIKCLHIYLQPFMFDNSTHTPRSEQRRTTRFSVMCVHSIYNVLTEQTILFYIKMCLNLIQICTKAKFDIDILMCFQHLPKIFIKVFTIRISISIWIIGFT